MLCWSHNILSSLEETWHTPTQQYLLLYPQLLWEFQYLPEITWQWVRHDISSIQSQGWPGTISSATTLNVNNVCHQPEDDNCVLSCVKVNVIKLWNEREIDLWSQLTPSSCSTYSVSINDITIGWQILNLLSHPNATLAPKARASGKNLNYVTLAP